MPLGSLLAASAFEVTPGQASSFEGGRIRNFRQVEQGLVDAATKGKLETGLPVSLRIDGDRSSPIRDAVMRAAFGKSGELLAASKILAARLGAAMDHRSSPCLLVLSVHDGGETRRQVVTWTFPREPMLRRAGATIELDNAFSLNSRLRKAALLSGVNNRSGFLSARVLDFQTTSVDRVAANFWIFEFLGAKLQIDSAEGTTRLAAVLRKANDRLSDIVDQEQLHTAIAAIRNSPNRRWSIAEFASKLMPEGSARESVLRAAGNGEETRAVFDLDLARFDELVQYRVYLLTNGVRISAPFMELGESVTIETDGQRRLLTATGTVESERVRSRA